VKESRIVSHKDFSSNPDTPQSTQPLLEPYGSPRLNRGVYFSCTPIAVVLAVVPLVNGTTTGTITLVVQLLLLCGLAIFATGSLRYEIRASIPPRSIAPLGACAGGIAACLSGLEFLADPANSKLYRLGFAGVTPSLSAIQGASWLTVAATLVFATTYLLGGPRYKLSNYSHLKIDRFWALSIMSIPAIMALLTSGTGRQESFADRGTASGQGLMVLSYWAIPLAISTFVLSTNPRNKTKGIAAVLLLFVLIFSGNRSPLLVIAVAGTWILLSQSSRGKLMWSVPFCIAAVILMTSLSSWRAGVASGVQTSLLSSTIDVAHSPIHNMTSAGLDTLDGYLLSQNLVHEGYSPPFWDPLKAVANFVPRQIWPEKPTFIGTLIGHEFLGLTRGGLFLSGLGYTSLLTGNLFFGLLLFTAFYLAVMTAARFTRDPLINVVLLYFSIRFSIGGDAFDLASTLQMLLLLGVATRLAMTFCGGSQFSPAIRLG
jgi:hypothetical protein